MPFGFFNRAPTDIELPNERGKVDKRLKAQEAPLDVLRRSLGTYRQLTSEPDKDDAPSMRVLKGKR